MTVWLAWAKGGVPSGVQGRGRRWGDGSARKLSRVPSPGRGH